MLEFFTYKKVKKNREEKAEKQKLENDNKDGKGKGNENGEKEKVTEERPKAIVEPSHSESSSSPEIVLESAEGTPILDKEDEKFLERLTSPSDASINNDDETPPPLPPRIKTPVIDLEDSDSSSFASRDESKSDKQVEASSTKEDGKNKSKDKGKEKDKHDGDNPKDKPKRFSFMTNLSRGMSLKRKPNDKHHEQDQKQDQDKTHLAVPSSSTGLDSDPEREARKDEADLARVLSGLDLVASAEDDKDGKDTKESSKVFSLSRESTEILRRFTQVLRDLANGVPTAYNDLMSLIEDRDGALARSYEKLPRSLRKLVAKLPDKLTSSLGPELLAVAAEAQGLEMAAGEGATKKLLSPGNLLELVTKPGAVAGLLKGIVNALKVRWPAAVVGTNVLWSVAVFLLLSALWYCYKRGRETRLEKEAAEAAIVVEVEEGDGESNKGEGKGVDGNMPLIEAPVEDKSIPQRQQEGQQQPTVSVSNPAASEGKKE